MICTTIQNKTLEQIYEALEQCEMAEIRLDRCDLTAKEIDELFTADIPLVATCRISEIADNDPALQDPKLTPQSREIKAMQIAERKLVKAIEAGARYVDVELEAPKQMSKRVRQAAHENGTVFIRSYHDFEGTDSLEALKAIVEKCVYHGADMVKIVTYAHSEAAPITARLLLSVPPEVKKISSGEQERRAAISFLELSRRAFALLPIA